VAIATHPDRVGDPERPHLRTTRFEALDQRRLTVGGGLPQALNHECGLIFFNKDVTSRTQIRAALQRHEELDWPIAGVSGKNGMDLVLPGLLGRGCRKGNGGPRNEQNSKQPTESGEVHPTKITTSPALSPTSRGQVLHYDILSRFDSPVMGTCVSMSEM
jgi:hypothetical protein